MKVKVLTNKWIQDIWIKLSIRVNSKESVIKDEMILWRNFTSFQIQDEVNCGRMKLTKTKIDISMTTMSPFWNLLTVLKFHIKGVDRTTKNM